MNPCAKLTRFIFKKIIWGLPDQTKRTAEEYGIIEILIFGESSF